MSKVIRIISIAAIIAVIAMMVTGCSKPQVSVSTQTPKEKYERGFYQAINDGSLDEDVHDQIGEILNKNNIKYSDFYVINKDCEKNIIILTETSVDQYTITIQSELGAKPDDNNFTVTVTDEWMGERGMFSWYQGRLREVLETGDDADKSAIAYYAPGGGERSIPWTMFLSFAEVNVDTYAKQLVFS